MHIVAAANSVAEPLRGIHRTAEPLTALATDHGPGDVRVGLFETWDQELAWITESISQRHRSLAPGETISVLAGTSAVLDKVDRALRSKGIPTQVHGAAAMLHQPAVQDLLAWLRVIHEPTANAALLRILSGPRWRIGPRDLAALGNRATELTGGTRRRRAKTLDEALAEALDGSDSVDVVALSDAVFDLGDRNRYSDEAFARLSEVAVLLREFRGCTGEPLGELLARVSHLTMIGIETQVTDPSGTQREALSAFANLADDFTDLDGQVGLGGFLTRIADAERMDISTKLDVIVRPGAVQLMSIHKSKGLEFTHVYLPSVTDGGFPGGKARGTWITDPSVVPWPLRHDCPAELPTYPPRDREITKKELDAYRDILRALNEREVDRLSYVALTRAQASVAVTAHWWGPTQKRPRGAHRFAAAVKAIPAASIIEWFPEPDKDAHNPSVAAGEREFTWPMELSAGYVDRVRMLADRVRTVDLAGSVANSDPEVQRWHTLAQALKEESQRARAPERVVNLGAAVGASTFLRALAEPEEVARDLLRPMPRKPSAAARRGTAWHAWVEARYGQQSLLDPDDLPGAADDSITSDEQLVRLKEAFELTHYANQAPIAVEQPFTLVLGGRLVHGRIDAVFEAEGHFDVIDWKTGGTEHLDPRQLAIYQLAWARIAGVSWQDVRAGFVMVSSGEIIRPDTDRDIRSFLALDS
jgi:DNA helicase-2/ATP-dependent DNA helicase PcrA